MHKFISLTFGVALLSGCTMIPNYERPAAPVAAVWQAGAPAQPHGAAVRATRTGWRTFYEDRRLQALIDLALKNNRDLRTAVLNVEKSRAQYRIQRASLLPSLDATGSGLRERLPASVSTTGQTMTTSQYSATAGVTSFEVDLFGRVRSLTREALEQYFATEEARLSAQITLISEVATQYLNELGLAEQREVARQTLTAVSASYDLTAMRYNAGTASELDLRTAQAEVQSAQANVAELDREVAQADNALTLLVGEPIPADLPPPGSLTSLGILAAIEAGIPSEILEARPDIREAEYQLKAANADIGAARAAFFPSIELTGSAGSTSSQLSGLFKPGSATWSFAPQVTLPLFAGGRNSANLDVAKVERSIEVANYEKTVQSAFREVSDALVAQTPLDAQVAAVQAQVEAEQARYRLTELRYKNGTDSYLAVLLAQEDLYTAQQNLIATRVTRLTNTVTLYKALGGGILEYSSPRS